MLMFWYFLYVKNHFCHFTNTKLFFNRASIHNISCRIEEETFQLTSRNVKRHKIVVKSHMITYILYKQCQYIKQRKGEAQMAHSKILGTLN